MKKDYITNSELCDILIYNSIKRAINTLGIERTLETIEKLPQAIYRAKLRQAYLNYLKK